jgi:hypothetical protein
MPMEPPELISARDHLARAEAGYRSRDGLDHLEEGLALLDEVRSGGNSQHATIARNLGSTYATKIYANVAALMQRDRGVPEPELELLFKVILAFDQGDFDLPANARAVKIGIAKRLIDHYYEGHSPQEKEKAIEQLMSISGQKPL